MITETGILPANLHKFQVLHHDRRGFTAMFMTKLKTISAAISMAAGLAGWAVAQSPDEKKAPAAEKPPRRPSSI